MYLVCVDIRQKYNVIIHLNLFTRNQKLTYVSLFKVFFVDPTRKTDIELIKMAEAFLVHSAPIRLSVVFVVNFDKDADPKEDANVAISRAFDYIRQEHTFPNALSFVTDVSFNSDISIHDFIIFLLIWK